MYRKKHIDMNFIVCIGAVLGVMVRIPWLPKKRSPTLPGEMLLKDFLGPLGVSRKEFARHLGWTYARLNERYCQVNEPHQAEFGIMGR